MKILLLGQGGQVGWELQRALAPLGELIGLDRHSRALHADLSQPEALAATVQSVRPDVIVNAAAHTAVDKAESEPELARAINALAPGPLAAPMKYLIMQHLSTNQLYIYFIIGSTFQE